MNLNDKKILEALVRKYGNDGVNNAISKLNESFQEDTKYVNVLFNDLPENDDQYKDTYEEDIEVGDVDPNKTSYEEYADRLNTLYVQDLEREIKAFDADISYPYYLVVNKDDDRENEVFDDLWKAVFGIAAGSYFSIKQVGGHLELEISHYNSQYRSYYSIYLLNDDGIVLYDDGNWDDLNNPKYWQPMKPIM